MSDDGRPSDRTVAVLLDQAAWGISPVLDVLHLDPLGIKARTFEPPSAADRALAEKVLDAAAWVLDELTVPGTAAWERSSAADRADWWVTRLGALNTVAVAFPGVLGALVGRLPIQDLLGFANQALVLVAVAREYGVEDRARQVDLLAAVLCRRELDARPILECSSRHEDAERDHAAGWRPFAVVGSMWRTAHTVRGLLSEIERRPRGSGPYRVLGRLPVVGALAEYLGERGALAEVASEVRDRIDAGRPAARAVR
ncbi:hypothetical protein [Rhodococcus sp. BE178]|uniref:hypothetical protein n=1 Tax=Rhodococcus sp. BE178 TaxID=2817737 RepID=UPI003D1F9017